jgi:hypothetical protein
MLGVRSERLRVIFDGPIILFLIGMRINKLWKVHKWLPVIRRVRRMLNELKAHPEIGCLGYFVSGMTVVQYWRSFDLLEAYAHSRNGEHWPAWVEFVDRMAACRGDLVS